MKFKEYLIEEYFTRVRSFEIFKNPSQNEIGKLIQQTKGKVRVLIDDKDRITWYIFPSNLLHQYAVEQLVEEGIEDTIFRASEILLSGNKIKLYFYYGSYEVKNNEVEFKSTNFNYKDYLWITKKLRFMNKEIMIDDKIIDEEYVTSFAAKVHSKNFKGGHTEIFKNPSKKEINDLIKNSKISAIRYWADLPNQDLYIWKADTVHYMAFDQLRKEGIEIDGKATVQGTAVFKNGKLKKADDDCKYYDWLHVRNDKGLSLNYLDNYFEKGSFKDYIGYE